MGPEISGHCANLAPTLGPGDTVLCVQPADTPDHSHDECDRGLEFEAPTGGAHARPFPG
jgi:hypothetical protein